MGIGIGVGMTIAIIVLVLGILWFYFWRRERQRKRRPDNQGSGSQSRGVFDSFGSTLVTSSRHHSDIPLQTLHEKDGKVVPRRGSEMMTAANAHEVSAAPPTREGRVRIAVVGDAAEMPTIWTEGYRGRPGEWIRRDSEMTVQVYMEAPERETPECESPERESEEMSSRAQSGPASTRCSAEERYTFWID